MIIRVHGSAQCSYRHSVMFIIDMIVGAMELRMRNMLGQEVMRKTVWINNNYQLETINACLNWDGEM